MRRQQAKQRLLQQLIDTLHQRLSEAEAGQAEIFAQQYFANFAADDLLKRDNHNLYGLTLSAWRFIQQADAADIKVKVFNPSVDRHGWQSPHTVIAILAADAPFLVDSVRGELNRRGFSIHIVHSVVFQLVRNASQQLQHISGHRLAGESGAQPVREEALMYFEINRHSDPAYLHELTDVLRDIIGEVQLVTGDHRAMTVAARAALESIDQMKSANEPQAIENHAFIEWLLDNHFTFLGYEYLAVKKGVILRDEQSRLGLLKKRQSDAVAELETEIKHSEPDALFARQLVCAKSAVRSRVHRQVYPDYITVKSFDRNGQLCGQHRLLGLYTSRVFTLSPTLIPIVRQKVQAVLERSGLDLGTHEGNNLVRLLEIFPREELLQSSVDELFVTTMAVNRIQERRQIRLFVRYDPQGKFVNCLVYMPRDIYRTELRQKIQQLLCDAFNAQEAEFTTFFSESILTRTHFVLRCDGGDYQFFDTSILEEEIIKVATSWQDHLRNALIEEFGEEQGSQLARQFGNAFPAGYMDDCSPRAAVLDIKMLLGLEQSDSIAMSLYRALEESNEKARFRLYHQDQPLPLSDVMPILENLGLRVVSESPYAVKCADGHRYWVHEFTVRFQLGAGIDVEKISNNFHQAFNRIWFSDADNDAFNRLVVGAGLDWREVAVLRAYARYLKQIQFSFSVDYIAETLSRHPELTRQLIAYFHQRHDPRLSAKVREDRQSQCRENILGALDQVENLNEDRIIRHYLALIGATLRTNYYQQQDGKEKPYIAFKLFPQWIPEMPLPKPMYEIFVYSPRFEGVHLRGGKVARGGLRWSDRQEDFRTEVLGLVKAQQVKNAVIVPTGAKGGFVAKRLPIADREAIQAEGIACYQMFIRGLLDVTDNLVDNQVVPPLDVVRHDEDDIYLVVAADKGTASFSDIANEISSQYGFWMADAFASGGSAGYDHKKMGITARGAWVSVQRHFRELGLNTQQQHFSVIGIGDMSGDVFGNGMLLSDKIQLVAAFNHMHIFIDPNPDTDKSYRERQRLFSLPRSGWDDYQRELISSGGGIFNRAAKSITLSPEIRERFHIDATTLTPNELIHALLKAPVDLLWNGGIGTYVKASSESHAEVGDKTNDSLRVNASELQCRVVGEGGNLGLTQLARVEYALNGGHCNTDFIDNAGGVDCSDHEVNIKILLNAMVNAGDMTVKQRNTLLEEMTESVADLVLENNYRQTQAISLAARESLFRVGEYRRLIQSMELQGRLSRELEFIPTDEQIIERANTGKGLTRPELSTLISYAKSQLKEALISSTVPDNDYISAAVETAFPQRISEEYGELVYSHRLRREIIATQLANDVVNHMGITYLNRMILSTGVGAAEVLTAYVTARDIFQMPVVWKQIELLDYKINADIQLEMMLVLIRLIRRASRWFIRSRRSSLDPAQEVASFAEPVRLLSQQLQQFIPANIQSMADEKAQRFITDGVPTELARYVAGASLLYPCLGIVDAANELGVSSLGFATVYFNLSHELDLDWFARELTQLKVDNHWHAMARETFRDDLEWQIRTLTISALLLSPDTMNDPQACVERWLQQHGGLVERWKLMLSELHAMPQADYAMYSVALRELFDMAQSCRHLTVAETA